MTFPLKKKKTWFKKYKEKILKFLLGQIIYLAYYVNMLTIEHIYLNTIQKYCTPYIHYFTDHLSKTIETFDEVDLFNIQV